MWYFVSDRFSHHCLENRIEEHIQKQCCFCALVVFLYQCQGTLILLATCDSKKMPFYNLPFEFNLKPSVSRKQSRTPKHFHGIIIYLQSLHGHYHALFPAVHYNGHLQLALFIMEQVLKYNLVFNLYCKQIIHKQPLYLISFRESPLSEKAMSKLALKIGNVGKGNNNFKQLQQQLF